MQRDLAGETGNPLPYWGGTHDKKAEVNHVQPSCLQEGGSCWVAIAECAKTIRYMEWFEVKETRGHIANDQVAHFQVVLQVGFRIAGS
tara:strand:- start:614 stop:877 length:264 start_codon:yes stop_codon:yes gene_type:complete